MVKGTTYIYRKQLLAEMYETAYGIYDHTTTANPLAGVLQHEAERYLDKYLFDNYLSTFVYKEIYQRTGLSFDEFLDRPRSDIEKIFKLVDEYNQKKAQIGNNLTNQFGKMDL